MDLEVSIHAARGGRDNSAGVRNHGNRVSIHAPAGAAPARPQLIQGPALLDPVPRAAPTALASPHGPNRNLIIQSHSTAYQPRDPPAFLCSLSARASVLRPNLLDMDQSHCRSQNTKCCRPESGSKSSSAKVGVTRFAVASRRPAGRPRLVSLRYSRGRIAAWLDPQSG